MFVFKKFIILCILISQTTSAFATNTSTTICECSADVYIHSILEETSDYLTQLIKTHNNTTPPFPINDNQFKQLWFHWQYNLQQNTHFWNSSIPIWLYLNHTQTKIWYELTNYALLHWDIDLAYSMDTSNLNSMWSKMYVEIYKYFKSSRGEYNSLEDTFFNENLNTSHTNYTGLITPEVANNTVSITPAVANNTVSITPAVANNTGLITPAVANNTVLITPAVANGTYTHSNTSTQSNNGGTSPTNSASSPASSKGNAIGGIIGGLLGGCVALYLIMKCKRHCENDTIDIKTGLIIG